MRNQLTIYFCALLLLAALPFSRAHAARMEVITLHSRALKNNVLHDPDTRLVPMFIPAQATNGARLPIVYYLPGYGNSADNFIKNSNAWAQFTQKISDEITPMIVVIGDGKTRWGGSQFLNSPAQGNYEDFICREVIAAVEHFFPAPENGVRRIVAGHSSGGFGALRLGSSHQKLFDGIVALSPDSAFPVSHRPLVELAVVSNTPLADIKKISTGRLPIRPESFDLAYAIGLSAAYAPSQWPWDHGQFDWLYDAHGKFRERVWRRWLDNDPLTIVKKNKKAFSARQKIYLEGAKEDQFAANFGAREIFKVLEKRQSPCVFYEPPGKHSDHVRERLQRGLEWVFEKPLTDIK
jgi:S-formylglutathione hydrolase FrmB